MVHKFRNTFNVPLQKYLNCFLAVFPHWERFFILFNGPQCDHLGIQYLAQGYLGSAVKVHWHIPLLPKPLLCFLTERPPPAPRCFSKFLIMFCSKHRPETICCLLQMTVSISLAPGDRAMPPPIPRADQGRWKRCCLTRTARTPWRSLNRVPPKWRRVEMRKTNVRLFKLI